MAPARRTDESDPKGRAPGTRAARSRAPKTIQTAEDSERNVDAASQHTRSPSDKEPIPGDLSYQQARTALDLLIAQLQASDLQVEEMLALYRRAHAYADHCEAVLQRVDQDVIEWDLLQDTQEMA